MVKLYKENYFDMNEEMRIYFRDLDYAVETYIETLNARVRKFENENYIIHKLMRMKYIKKIPRSYVEELKCIPEHLITKVYGKRTTVLAERNTGANLGEFN